MKTRTLVLSILLLITLSGCASGCQHHCLLGFGPGNSAFESVALYMDRTDPCQTGMGNRTREELGRPEGYQRPSWCGAGRSASRMTVNDKYGNTVGYVK